VPHRAHEHLIRIALETSDSVLIQPVIGLRKEGDFSSNAIIRGYEVLISEFLPSERIMLVPIKIPMWFAGPREALLHAIIRKNFGCSHFIVGRDQAGVGNWYGKYDAQDLAIKHEKELQIKILPLREPFYCSICGSMASENSCSMNHQTGGGRHEISGTWLRKTIRNSERIDNRLVRPQVIDEILKLGDIFE